MDQRVLVLFDVDGTLTKSRLNIEKDAFETLQQLKKKHSIGLISGSNLPKVVG